MWLRYSNFATASARAVVTLVQMPCNIYARPRQRLPNSGTQFHTATHPMTQYTSPTHGLVSYQPTPRHTLSFARRVCKLCNIHIPRKVTPQPSQNAERHQSSRDSNFEAQRGAFIESSTTNFTFLQHYRNKQPKGPAHSFWLLFGAVWVRSESAPLLRCSCAKFAKVVIVCSGAVATGTPTD